jgi:hypothetical protein
MYEHFYVLEELQKQRASEIKKQVTETNRSNNKLFRKFIPTFKQNKQIGY